METLVFNNDNLTKNDINSVVTRVKVFLINSKNEILLASSNGGVQLPGGHVENGETFVAAVIREVMEETGICLENAEVPVPFFMIEHYTKNYNNKNGNKLSILYYYCVFTNKLPNYEKLNLTENEKLCNFNTTYVKIENFGEVVQNVAQNNDLERNRIIAIELLESFKYLRTYLKI